MSQRFFVHFLLFNLLVLKVLHDTVTRKIAATSRQGGEISHWVKGVKISEPQSYIIAEIQHQVRYAQDGRPKVSVIM